MNSALDLVHELALRRDHSVALPPACEAEAAAWHASPGIDDPALIDRTDLAFCTIDYVSSLDLDQALFIQPDDDGGFVVWYAIADAAYYVRPGSALFDEALRRGATYYLPGLVVPMLPLSLCQDLVSLNPQVDRRAMVFRMQVDAHGVCTGTTIERARIHSRAKLAYEHVQAWLDGGDAPCPDAAVLDSLRQLKRVGELRMAEAESRDVVRFKRQEVDVRLDGLRFLAATALRHDVERYNEQISLMANIEGGRLLQRGHPDVQPVFRTHAPPDTDRLTRLARQIDALIDLHDLDPSWRWAPGGPESLSSYLRRLPDTGVARAIARQALFTGGRSGFSAEPARHHGVGAEVYARFTAPMREMVGVFVHKELWEGQGAAPGPRAVDRALQTRVMAAANRAKQEQRVLTRQVNRMALDALFSRDVRAPTWRPGVVMGMTGKKVHVQLDDPAIDVKVYVFDLSANRGARCTVREGELLCRGERIAAVGQSVQVRVMHEDTERDRWALDLRVNEPERGA